MNHILVNTSLNWNCGDDFIRDGVFRLLNINVRKTPVYYFNHGLTSGDKFVARVRGNGLTTKDAVFNSRLFVAAGTPAWFTKSSDIYSECLDQKVPIIICGAGMGQAHVSILKELYDLNLLICATTRDGLAHRCISIVGVPCKPFLDPAFYCQGFDRHSKDLGIILNYKGGTNGKYSTHHDQYYLDLYNKYKSDISAIVVHEAPEKKMAEQLFNRPAIFSDDFNFYIDLYSRCSVYIGGRIHGAICSAAAGAFCVLICDDSRRGCITSAKSIFTQLGCNFPMQLLTYSTDINSIHLDICTENYNEIIHQNFLEHQNYLLCSMRQHNITI